MPKNDRYTYRVTWSDEDNGYVGLCAEFPSLSWLAALPEDALCGIRKVVAEVVADLKTKGEEIPEPIAVSKDSGKFQSILKIAEQQIREGKGMKHADFWRELEAEKE